MSGKAAKITLTEEQEGVLQQIARSTTAGTSQPICLETSAETNACMSSGWSFS